MRPGEGGDATDGVHDAGAGEVDVADAEAHRVPRLGQPAAAPGPRREQRVVDARRRTGPRSTKLFHFHRSAIAPVGIVATVSMKATM